MLKKLCVAALLTLPLSAMADGLSYRYLEASYGTVDFDGGGDADGFAIGGSFLLAPQVYVTAGYGNVETDTSPKIEASTFSAALGFRQPLTSSVDANFEVGFLSAEVDAGSFGSDDDTGYSLAAGLRAMVAKQLELNGGVSYAKVFDEGETSFGLGAVFSFTPQVAVLAGADFGDDSNSFSVGGRFMF
ncbi:MAG: outer membrane beta-barrel protein [Pseudomonadota bacterium]